MNQAKKSLIEGVAAPLPIANLDTDQIMPKQFLRGIDKNGLDKGVLYDYRFDLDGNERSGFVLNQPQYRHAPILVAGANFGCGSSREHAVWGLQQFGIRAIIAPSFAEIFYSNAMNNGLMLVALPPEHVELFLAELQESPEPVRMAIEVEKLTVTSPKLGSVFTLGERHRQMFLNGLDMIGASLQHKADIEAFAAGWYAQHPWLKDLSANALARISEGRSAA
ncbi:3-isopropylmalate dehydratase, small subunit [Noviherbaspirillum humi]|uniref:3-isopropylmalate dehydratase small subunit n=1 Tax=Noviherbaspirillum humi TaxID=1688639 RepID=A0A239L500_9BURK|nr:3-isopropylmalate dehydratase small subunit [Noviherbaspirillum humi]SNT24624.1 3-isopropylmalate dehydratase, small subunit [Noviherbaspirillum humi]